MPVKNNVLRNVRSKILLAALKLVDRQAHRVIGGIVQDRLSYLSAFEVYDLWQRVHEVEKQKLTGVLIEAGCALGGSAIAISAIKRTSRPFLIFDTFGLIPPPSKQDGPDAHERFQEIAEGKARGTRGDPYYGYQKDLFNIVRGNLERFGYDLEEQNIQLTKGRFSETLFLTRPVAFAHIDVDWYESVKICLERIEPLLVPHGILIVDDYFFWSGCRKAVDEFFYDKQDAYVFEKRSTLHIIKK